MNSFFKKTGKVVLASLVSLSSLTFVKATTIYSPGATVVKDENSPSGYTVHFVYDGSDIDKTKTLESVSVTGPFQYVDPNLDLKDINNVYSPDEYKDGMYATNCAPGPFKWGYTEEMVKDPETGNYTASFPITSGSFAYSYSIKYAGETAPVSVDDPANPSPAKNNPDSVTQTGDITHSIVYGKWDEEKQSKSPNLDFVLESTGNKGSQSYVSYKGVDGKTQYLGVYLPYGYDENRTEPYKVIYASHGGGGNETDWFAMGHVDNIMDNLANQNKIKDTIVVTMDNAYYGSGRDWKFDLIEQNVLDYIIPYVEENYNVSTSRDDRAFCGLSMGGMTTTHMYFDHPDQFGYFGIFSGTDMDAVTENGALVEPKVMLAVGTCDVASEKIVPNDSENLKKYEDLLRWNEENQVIDLYDAGYIQGAHDWFTWSQCFEQFASKFVWTNQPSSYKAGVTVEENTDSRYVAPYQATFVYEDTDVRNAVKVTVSGNFQFYKEDDEACKNYIDTGDYSSAITYSAFEYEEGMFNTGYPISNAPIYELNQTKDERFELTIPLPGNLYYYDYTVTYADGSTETIKDPANLPVANVVTGHDAGHSLFYVGNETSTIKGQEYIYARTDGKTGSYEYVSYLAKDGTTQPLGIYLPYNYSIDKTYKTLYVSHGGGGNEAEWMTIGALPNIMDNLIASGEVEDTIVVTMDNNYYKWDQPSRWDYDSIKVNLMDNIIPFVESRYSVSKASEDRAFSGLSMGGGTANSVYNTLAKEFKYIGIWSGCLPNTDFSAVPDKDYPILMLGCGNVDFAGPGFPILKKALDEANTKYSFHLVNGAHDWGTWRNLFTIFVKDYLWTKEEVVPTPTPTPTPDKKDDTVITPSTDTTVKKAQTNVNTGDTTPSVIGFAGLGMVALVASAYLVSKKRK